MPTIRDVARRAGVAPITVSRVINHSGYVSEGTRQRVENAIAELKYVPNALAQGLRFNKTNVIALVLSDVTNPFWTTVARGTEDAASEQNYSIILCNTDENVAKQDKYVALLLQRQVDGFLLVPAPDTADTIRLIQQQKVSLVILDRQLTGVSADVVRGDSEGGAYELTRYLIGLGHRRIAILSGPETTSTSTQRVAGYRRALEDARLKAEPELISYGRYYQDSGYERTRHLLTLTRRPTALFAGNNFIAIGVMKALYESGLRVPEDISVVGFDDLPPGLVVQPFLTVVAQPAYEMGYRATKLLLARIAHSGEPAYQEIVLPIQLVIRQSCRSITEPVGENIPAVS
jgi:LacI family transcriptional regulator